MYSSYRTQQATEQIIEIAKINSQQDVKKKNDNVQMLYQSNSKWLQQNQWLIEHEMVIPTELQRKNVMIVGIILQKRKK